MHALAAALFLASVVAQQPDTFHLLTPEWQAAYAAAYAHGCPR